MSHNFALKRAARSSHHRTTQKLQDVKEKKGDKAGCTPAIPGASDFCKGLNPAGAPTQFLAPNPGI